MSNDEKHFRQHQGELYVNGVKAADLEGLEIRTFTPPVTPEFVEISLTTTTPLLEANPPVLGRSEADVTQAQVMEIINRILDTSDSLDAVVDEILELEEALVRAQASDTPGWQAPVRTRLGTGVVA